MGGFHGYKLAGGQNNSSPESNVFPHEGFLDIAAMIRSMQGRYDEAEPLFPKSLEKRKQKLGEDHPDTLTSVNILNPNDSLLTMCPGDPLLS